MKTYLFQKQSSLSWIWNCSHRSQSTCRDLRSETIRDFVKHQWRDLVRLSLGPHKIVWNYERSDMQNVLKHCDWSNTQSVCLERFSRLERHCRNLFGCDQFGGSESCDIYRRTNTVSVRGQELNWESRLRGNSRRNISCSETKR